MTPRSRPTRRLAPGLRWVLYLRQSSRKRSPKTGVTSFLSFELQEETCRAAIARVDSEPISIVVITDHNRPGGRGKRRPGRDRLLEMCRAGEVDAVMSYKVSRIGRDLGESVALYDDCRDHGVQLYTSDLVDLNNPIVRGAMMGMAESENSDRSDVARQLLENRRAKHLPPVKGGRAFGLRWDEDRLAKDPEEWPAVEMIFRRFDAGLTIGAIARALTDARIPRRGGVHCQWSPSAVSKILHSTWYIGLVPDGDDYWRSGQDFLAPVDPELWNRVKARLGERKRSGQNLDHALSGLLFCGRCGGWSPMSLCYARHRRADGSLQLTHRYRCVHHVHDRAFCAGQSISSPALERELLRHLAAVVDGDELAEARFMRRTRTAAEDSSAEADKLAQRIAAVRAKRDALSARLLEDGFEVERDWFNAQMRSFAQEIEVLKERHDASADRATLSRAGLVRLRSDLLGERPFSEESWFALAEARRNEFLRLLFPDGLLIDPAPRGAKRGRVDGRIRVRTSADASAAAERKASMSGRTIASARVASTTQQPRGSTASRQRRVPDGRGPFEPAAPAASLTVPSPTNTNPTKENQHA